MSRIVNQLVPYRATPVVGPVVTKLLALAGTHIPATVVVGKDFFVPHRDGIMIDPRTVIGDRVTIFHQVTIAGRDVYLREDDSSTFGGVVVEDDVVLCPGAKILGGPGRTVIGRGTIVGANAVLTRSTGENEVWAGVPARCIGTRDGKRVGFDAARAG